MYVNFFLKVIPFNNKNKGVVMAPLLTNSQYFPESSK